MIVIMRAIIIVSAIEIADIVRGMDVSLSIAYVAKKMMISSEFLRRRRSLSGIVRSACSGKIIV